MTEQIGESTFFEHAQNLLVQKYIIFSKMYLSVKQGKPIPIDKKQKFYSSKIFMNNNGLNILRPNEIDDANMWVQHNNHDVKFYWGIVVCAIEEPHVDFIVQIDFLEEELDFVDKTNDEEIRRFIERNLTAYVNFIHLSYLLSLSGKNQIEEV